MAASPFAEWLIQQLKLRRMSQAEFCRRGGISPGMVSQFLVGERGAGEGLYRAVSLAFEMPMTEVLKIVGLIPENEGEGDYSVEDNYILQMLKELPPEIKQQVVDYIEFLRTKRRLAE